VSLARIGSTAKANADRAAPGHASTFTCPGRSGTRVGAPPDALERRGWALAAVRTSHRALFARRRAVRSPPTARRALLEAAGEPGRHALTAGRKGMVSRTGAIDRQCRASPACAEPPPAPRAVVVGRGRARQGSFAPLA
jgi:hypothetical protein